MGIREREKLGRKPVFLAGMIGRTVGNLGEAHDMFSAKWGKLKVFVGYPEGLLEAGV